MKNKMIAIVINSKGKKVKTISGTTNLNGYFYNTFNKYCKEKGYNQLLQDSKYTGGCAWSNGNDILEFIWINESI